VTSVAETGIRITEEAMTEVADVTVETLEEGVEEMTDSGVEGTIIGMILDVVVEMERSKNLTLEDPCYHIRLSWRCSPSSWNQEKLADTMKSIKLSMKKDRLKYSSICT
jgi:hypothetical protein